MKKKSRIALIALVSLGMLASCTGNTKLADLNAPILYAGDDSEENSSEDPISSSENPGESSSESSSEAPISSSENPGESSSEEPSSDSSSSSRGLPSISLPDIPIISSESSSEDSSSSGDKEDEEKTEEIMLGSVDDWNEFADHCNADAGYSFHKEVYLRSDIDFEDQPFTPIDIFHGTFDGNYHALKNIHITGEKDYPSLFHIIAKDGIVKRLDVLDLNIDCQDEDYVGVISKNYGTVVDLTVTGSILGQNYVGVIADNGVRSTIDKDGNKSTVTDVDALLNRITNHASVSGLSNVGGVAGMNFGTIKGSTNKGEIKASAKNANSTAIDIGGIAGYSLGKLDGNENYGEITSDGIQTLQVGGIAGKGNGEFYFERNYGTVTGTKYVGGICGYYGNIKKNSSDLQEYFNQSNWEDFVNSNKDWLKNLGFDVDNDDINADNFEEKATTIAFDYSYSDGQINGDSDVGGIVGISTSDTLNLKEAVSKSDVNLRVGTFAGGIAGQMDGGTISSSIASGHIKGTVDVGGIAGHAVNLKDNLSSALVEGTDRVGGVVGSLAGEMTSNLSNALVVNADAKTSAGSLAGVVENYDEVADSFAAKVQYNYYVSDLGGISRRQYGSEFKDAAKKLTIDEMTTDDNTLSTSFGDGFDKDSFLPGKDKDYFPTPKYLSEVDVDKSYGSEDSFKGQYNEYSSIYKSAAKYDSKVSCLVTFMEWQEDYGDLYDDYGRIDKTHYKITSYEKVAIHEKLSEAPAFKYAEKQDDQYIYTGKKNTYIVSWDLPKDEISESTIVYANYSERVKTLTYNNNEYVVEGAFEKGTTIEVVENASVQNSTIYSVKFYDKDGNEISVKNVTLKINMKKHPKKIVYYVDGALTNRISGATDSSSYFVFRYSTGQYFTYLDETDVTEELPAWVIPTIGAAIAAIVAILILAIGLSIGRKKGIKEEQKANGTYAYHTLADNTHARAEEKEEDKKDSTEEKKGEPKDEK